MSLHACLGSSCATSQEQLNHFFFFLFSGGHSRTAPGVKPGMDEPYQPAKTAAVAHWRKVTAETIKNNTTDIKPGFMAQPKDFHFLFSRKMRNTFLSSKRKEHLDRKNSCQLVSCMTRTAASGGKKEVI